MPPEGRQAEDLTRSELEVEGRASFTLQLGLAWSIIAAAIVMAERSGAWRAVAPAIPVIATRQALLFLLIHEQVHLRHLRRGSNDAVRPGRTPRP